MSKGLLSEITAFLEETGIDPGRFGWDSAANWRLVERLTAGRPVLTDTADKVRDWMRRYRAGEREDLRRRRGAESEEDAAA